jgi:hypothetical protein
MRPVRSTLASPPQPRLFQVVKVTSYTHDAASGSRDTGTIETIKLLLRLHNTGSGFDDDRCPAMYGSDSLGRCIVKQLVSLRDAPW